MKSVFKVLFTSAFLLAFITSCSTCRVLPADTNMDSNAECGFGDETSEIEAPVFQEKKRTSPAANRSLQIATVDVVDDENVVASQSTSTVTEKKSSRLPTVVKKAKKKKVLKGMLAMKKLMKERKNSGGMGGDMLILLVILCLFIPWLAVGIYTNWDLKLTLLTVLLWILGVLPGIIFGMLVLFDVVG